MKNLWLALAAITAVAAALTMTSCGGDGEYKHDAQGAPYEVVVVADHAQWDGAVGDTLRSMFHRRFPMVNREETMFKVLRVLPEGFKRFVPRHRNILIVNVGEQFAEPSLTFVENVYARPQVVITASAPDNASMVSLLAANSDNILLLLEDAEKDRDVAAATGHTPTAITELIREKFGFEMSMGPAYTVQSDKEDFLWLAYKMPTSDQGIVIYSYPFSGVKDFDKENLLRRRDEFVSLIPAENPGSHMITVPDVELIYKKIDGRQWSEMRGFWDVAGDFMGGPFVSYSTLDAANQRVVAIDLYVFSPDPRLSQRNYIKQLEHYLYTVKFL